MANTLNDMFPDLYAAKDIVSRELTGFIRAVTRDSRVERAAKDQTVRVPVTPAATAADTTPAVNAPDTGDQTIDNVSVTISKSRHVPVRWNGEESMGLRTAGTFSTINRDRFVQAMRTLVNEIEADVASLYKKASRATGTAGTAPFGTADVLTDAAVARQILEDNGAPQSDLHMVLGSAAMANLRGKQSVLFKVNEAGTEEMLRRGTIGELQGFELHGSAQVASHTKGTGTSYLINNASGEAVGETTLTLDTGSGTIIAGDILTHASDSDNKYVVTTALSGGDVVIAKPGLRIAAADDDAVTVGNDYAANMVFHRGAILLATRQPALPDGGDAADDRTVLTDEHSGLSFEVAIYKQFRQVVTHISIAWGFELIKPEHTAILLG